MVEMIERPWPCWWAKIKNFFDFFDMSPRKNGAEDLAKSFTHVRPEPEGSAPDCRPALNKACRLTWKDWMTGIRYTRVFKPGEDHHHQAWSSLILIGVEFIDEYDPKELITLATNCTPLPMTREAWTPEHLRKGKRYV